MSMFDHRKSVWILGACLLLGGGSLKAVDDEGMSDAPSASRKAATLHYVFLWRLVPADHASAILPNEAYQNHLNLRPEQRTAVDRACNSLRLSLTADLTLDKKSELLSAASEQMTEVLDAEQRAELAKLERVIKYWSLLVNDMRRGWLCDALELSDEQLRKLADLEAASILEIQKFALARDRVKLIEQEVASAKERVRDVLTESQQSRWDQIQLQQQVWRQGPGALLSDDPRLASLNITTEQRAQLERFVAQWRKQLKPTRFAELMAQRQAGLDEALKLLSPAQKTRWTELLGAEVDWRTAFGFQQLGE
jgi:hypothetical protein